MAVYDPAIDKVVVRVVYDGPGTAGKTTNLQKLAHMFTLARRSEISSPEETAGRTTYFDWLRFDSGIVQGRPLRTEFVTVPGQRVLARRRFSLIDQADAIVFVVDCRPGKLPEAKAMYAGLQNHLAARGYGSSFPIIIQANKQDVLGAATVEQVRDELEAELHHPIIEAEAHQDRGVRETAVLAIRAATQSFVERWKSEGLEALQGSSSTPEELKAHLDELERQNPLSPAAILLAPTVPFPEEPQPSDESPPEPSEAREAESPLAAESAIPVEPVEPPPPRSRLPSPVLPSPEAESGWIWPPTTGRNLLRKALLHPATRMTQRSDETLLEQIHRAPEHRLHISSEHRYPELESARKALVALARTKSQLGTLLPTESVLSLASASDGSFWIWTTSSWLDPLTVRWEEARERQEEATQIALLDTWAEAHLIAARLAAHTGILLELELEHFALDGDALRYLSNRITSGAELIDWGRSILTTFSRFEDAPLALQAFSERLIHGLNLELDAEAKEHLRLIPQLEEAKDFPESALLLRDQLLAALTP